MRGLADEHGLALYDLARSMLKSLEFFYDDVHFNVEGARVAGLGLAQTILERDLLPRPSENPESIDAPRSLLGEKSNENHP